MNQLGHELSPFVQVHVDIESLCQFSWKAGVGGVVTVVWLRYSTSFSEPVMDGHALA